MALKHLAAWLLLLATGSALAGKTVTIGQTYPIAEPDVLDEIKSKASEKDWRNWMQKKAAPDATAFQSVALPRSAKNDTYLFDPTYTLPMDIPDENGKILFPAGYRINIYTKVRMPGRIIVVGPTKADFKWLDAVAKPTQNDKVLLASGNVLEVRRITQRNIYLLEPRAVERFGLRAIPSIVQQEGLNLRVTEYAIAN